MEQPPDRYTRTNYWQHAHAQKPAGEMTFFNSRGYQVDDYSEQNDAKDGDADGCENALRFLWRLWFGF